MEIGAEFGGSTRRFLGQPNAWVISVDPWPDSYAGNSFPHLKSHLNRHGAMYELFQSFCWEHRSRLAAVRMASPSGLLAVYDSKVNVDIVYIDGDHRYDAVMRDLTVSRALFPDAIIAGDDWLLRSRAGKYEGMDTPVQHAVKSWASFNDVAVEVEANTWILDFSRSYNIARPERRFSRASSDAAPLDRLERLERAVVTLERKLERRSVARRALRRLKP